MPGALLPSAASLSRALPRLNQVPRSLSSRRQYATAETKDYGKVRCF
jgi:hypothetical protein